MRYQFLPVAVLLAAAAPVAAQVTVNPHALEPLGGGAAAPSPAKHPSHGRTSAKHHHPSATRKTAEPAKPEQPNGRKPATAARAPVVPAPRSLVHQPPVVPPTPPPVVTLAPLQPPPPAHPAPPAQPTPVVAGATGEALPIPDGLRVTFGPGTADLNPQTDAALQKLAHETAAKPDVTVTVMAYAAGAPDDPSTPRRLSLSRALATRTVLISQGISSTRIYLRALGASVGEGPADRVDVTVNGLAAAAKP